MPETVKVEGLAELKRKLHQLPAQLRVKGRTNPLQSATMAGALPIQKAAKAMVPVDTGTLQNNIVRQRVRKSSFDAETAIRVRVSGKGRASGDDAFYWPWVEFGTEKMPARPFLRPALRAGAPEALKRFKKSLEMGLVKAVKKLR